ncbi:MAG: hypothetical protein KJI69_04480 [Patescibacteria group bacterium]|nr:hypothetical protein [Patescibacteria group bacterium]
MKAQLAKSELVYDNADENHYKIRVQSLPDPTRVRLIINPIKDQLQEEHQDQYRYWISFKKASLTSLIDSVDDLTKKDVVRDIMTVKNAICFTRDGVLFCKHYDTIIFAYELQSKKVLELYANCSQTTNRQLDYIVSWLKKQGHIDQNRWDWIRENHTKYEPTTRGVKNKFWDSEYGGGF